jgi:polyisoprenoid-binding protein YceI
MVCMSAQREHATKTPRLGRYAVDTRRSGITFRSRHMFGLLPVRGTFVVRSGTVDVAEPLAESRIEVEVDAASFHTGNDHRDGDVRSAKFLDVANHPVFTFVSDTVGESEITGTLTAHGVARPVTLTVDGHEPEQADGSFTVRATTRVDRTDFGITAARGLAGRHLDLTLEVVCVHQ